MADSMVLLLCRRAVRRVARGAGQVVAVKKLQRIDALESDLDGLAQQVDRLAARIKALETPPAPVQSQPFGDRVRSEFAERAGRILQAVGL
jgi:hypothetical protein